jgi:probable HAF family extracellular repeat protein/parallel beta-helix repeat protein
LCPEIFEKRAFSVCFLLSLGLIHIQKTVKNHLNAAPPRYEITDLGTLGGGHSSAKAINDAGQVVGWSSTADGFTLAFLWDTVNGMIDLGTLDGQYSKAYSINRSGQIVGKAYTASGYWRATLFHPTGEGNNIDLGTLGGDRSYASSINDNGQIVGWAQIASGERHATLFDPTGGRDNIDLGTLGGDESWASSINNSSQIVGTAYRLFTSPGGRFPPVTSSYLRATLFDATGQGNNIDLGALLYTYGGRYCSGAMSINENGNIVGAAWNEDPFPFVQENSQLAVLFDPTRGENNIFLGTLGWYCSSAYSINNRDQIIGWGGICSNHLCGKKPALFDPNGVDPNGFDPTGQDNNVNLYDLIDPSCGWILKEVWSINDSGWIVGEGINPDGETHAFLMTPIPPKIIYVDDDASGANNGSSCADAFIYLQDALTAAWSGDEIHVAQGIYTPDSNSTDPNGSSDRTATFQLINGVTIKGGYAGTGTPDPNARDIQLYETILNGDLNGNDIAVNDPHDLRNEPTRAENSYNVVRCTRTDETALLDGFTVTGGNSNGTYLEYSNGGGMFNDNSSSKVSNCTFIGNNHCGIAYFYNNTPTLTNCTFIGNDLGVSNHYDSSSTLRNCTFIGNREGIESYGGITTLTNCIFSGNRWAAFFDYSNSKPILMNCTFSGNTNVIGVDGDAIAIFNNCVLWGNERLQYDYDGELIINYSCIQGWTGGLDGTGNIDADPCFVEPGYWDANDVWVNGDYHLLPGSPCIDAGEPDYVSGPNETDLDGRPRVIGGRIDMGAYELPIFAEARFVPRTINLASKGKSITCYIRLPEGYDVADIDPNSVLLEDEIKPEQFSVDEHKQVATAAFDREKVQGILNVGDIELKITCQLTDGTYFEATDIVQVTDKGSGKSSM